MLPNLVLKNLFIYYSLRFLFRRLTPELSRLAALADKFGLNDLLYGQLPKAAMVMRASAPNDATGVACELRKPGRLGALMDRCQRGAPTARPVRW